MKHNSQVTESWRAQMMLQAVQERQDGTTLELVHMHMYGAMGSSTPTGSPQLDSW